MSFIQLQREPGIHYLVGHQNFRTSPAFEHLLEAKCAVRTITPVGDMETSLHVPLSDFAMFPAGSLFGQGKAVAVRNRDRRRSRRTILLGDQFETWDVDRLTRIKAKKLLHPYDLTIQHTEKVFIDQMGAPRPLGLMHSEQFRFICSGVSFLLDTLSLRSVTSQKSLASMFVDEAETGIDASGTYVITPLRPFQNATATLQIALLLTNPDIADYIRFFFRRVGSALRGEPIDSMRAWTFQDPLDCTIESEPLSIQHGGKERIVDYCDRIVADHRKPAFKDIVVRIRNTRADEQIEMIEELRTREEKEQLRVASSTKVRRYPADKRTVRLGRMDGEFGRLFPEFAKLNLRFDRERAETGDSLSRTSVTKNGSTRPDFVSPLASSTPPELGGTVPQLKSGPVETVVFERPNVATRFLATSDAPGLEPLIIKLDEMPLLMREFYLAGYYMEKHRSTSSLPDYAMERGEELLFRLPTTWGGFAAPDKKGFDRYVAAFPLAFDHGTVWAIEILRNDPREIFAMGLVAQLDREDGLSFLGRALRSVCDRVGRRRGGDLSGTFPRADFVDTRIDTVAHKQTVWDARTLSQIIPSRAELLLSPERNF
ncbi:hypothetical protein CD351_00260 [Erythrobacter sp. KY5]|nr:hypothetical protein CD351_00260 [Erythrobacter sp. KY5]